jgi:hypothetical protein
MKNNYSTSILILALSILFISCKKEKEPTPTPVVNTPAAVSGSFTWTEDNGAIITADSAFWTTWSSGTGIRAYKAGMDNFFEMNWSGQDNISVAAKTMSATNGGFTFLKGTASYNISQDQSINIAAFNNNLLSGNFDLTLTGGTITKVTGTFTELVKR